MSYDRTAPAQPWQPANRDTFTDLAPCQRCGKDVVLDHDEPCAHGVCICDTCDPSDVCHDCARQEVTDLRATVRRVESLRAMWAEAGMYGSPHSIRAEATTRATTLARALRGEPA